MRVVILLEDDGGFRVVTDHACEVFTVQDSAPNDRVYRLSAAHTISFAEVDKILGDDPVGHSGDARHETIKNRILSAEAGERHLKPV